MYQFERTTRQLVKLANEGLKQSGRAYIQIDGASEWLEINQIEVWENSLVNARLVRDDLTGQGSLIWVRSERLAAVRVDPASSPSEPN